MNANIEENLKKLPDKPGVYIHHDKMGQIIYVGKAISLKKRVRQYFQSSRNMDLKVRAMVGQIAFFEYIVCKNEMEAFILENNLIKQHRPRYNILLKDDKTYPYIQVTLNEKWPRIVKTRVIAKDRSRYFGPYSDVTSLNVMVDLLNDVFRLKHCAARSFRKGARPCLNYHIGKCDGICQGNVDHAEYMSRVEAAMAFLSGRDKSLISHLKEQMKKASDDMDYETAAKYRDYLLSAESLMDRQSVDFKKDIDIDAVLPVGEKHVALFTVRDGKLAGRETFRIQSEAEDSPGERVGSFIKQYYTEMPQGPDEIIVSDLPEEREMIEELLSGIWERKVSIHKPQKGEKKALLSLAENNRDEMLKTMEEREERASKKNEEVLAEIAEVIKLVTGREAENREYRVEAYDVSNTNGVDTVAAMVVYRGLRPDRKSYRRFKVRTDMPGDDYASMQEVLYRRIKRAQENDPSFLPLPDLIILDGGKGHLNAALQIEKAMNVDIPMVGAVKDDSHRTRGLVYMRGDEPVEMDLKTRTTLFSFVGSVQEEVHRFAIEYHRKIRDKGALVSVLDEIDGIGPVKRNALLRHFGSVKHVQEASRDELLKVPELREKDADAVLDFFSRDEEKNSNKS